MSSAFNIKLGVDTHISKLFPSSEVNYYSCSSGGIVDSNPDFLVCEVENSVDNKSWIYISVGASKYLNSNGEHIEFAIISPRKDLQIIENLAMITHYHSNINYRLSVGNVVNIGSGWVHGSNADHFLVSLPYFIGEHFENCFINGHLIRILWLVPITTEEYKYMKINGLDALEEMFENKRVAVSDPYRPSAI